VIWSALSTSIAVAQAVAAGICARILYTRSKWKGVAPVSSQLESLISMHPSLSNYHRRPKTEKGKGSRPVGRISEADDQSVDDNGEEQRAEQAQLLRGGGRVRRQEYEEGEQSLRSASFRSFAEMQKREKKQQDLMVLPVYYRLMLLQFCHCALWAILAIYVVSTGEGGGHARL
jgi:hypothetical protein